MTTSRRVPAVKIKMSRRLFELIEKHHTSSLRHLFLQHYQRLDNGNHDYLWVTRLPPGVKNLLRLHLCVVRRGDVLDWTDQEIGRKIIQMFNKKRKRL